MEAARTRKSVSPNAVKIYHEFLKSDMYRYVIFSMTDDNKDIIMDKIGCEGDSFENFLKEIPKTQTRYIFYKCERKYTKKVLFIFWFPDFGMSSEEKAQSRLALLDLKKKCNIYNKLAEIKDFHLLKEDFLYELSQ